MVLLDWTFGLTFSGQGLSLLLGPIQLLSGYKQIVISGVSKVNFLKISSSYEQCHCRVIDIDSNSTEVELMKYRLRLEQTALFTIIFNPDPHCAACIA